MTEQQLLPVLKIEKQLDFKEIDMILAKELQNMAPFGKEIMLLFLAAKMFKWKIFILWEKKKYLKNEIETKWNFFAGNFF